MITGTTRVIAHLGYPTETFKAPQIYNPWFEARGIDAVVVPLGVRSDDYPGLLKALSAVTNMLGVQVGTDLLFEMIPAYLAFFGFGSATPEELRALGKMPR